MTDQMPMFDDPIPSAEPAPKKQRRKPMKRTKREKKLAAVPKVAKKRRNKRGPNKGTAVKRVGAEPRSLYSQQRFSKETYAIIRSLIAMDAAMRDTVFSLVQGLCNGRSS